MRRLLKFFWLFLILGSILGYSLYLDNAGILATGKVTAKQESVRVHNDDFFRNLSVTAHFPVPGEPNGRSVQGYLDAATFDRTRVGDPIQVRYLPSPILHQIVLIPSARLATLNTFSVNSDDQAMLLRTLATVALLILLLVLAVKLRSKVLALPILLLFAFAFLYFLFPRQLPPPAGNTVSARATVHSVSTVTRILEGKGRRSRGISLSQPFDIVQLSYTPAGRPEPVIGVDEIDHDSIPALTAGDLLPIEYQADQPRTVRLLQGERTFPIKAREGYLMSTAAMFLFLFTIHWIGHAIHSKAQRTATRLQSALAAPQTHNR